MTRRNQTLALTILGFALCVTAARAQFASFTGVYSQDFDSLASNAEATPATHTWTQDSTLDGWYAFTTQTDPDTAILEYRADNGNSTAGGIHSYGSTESSERALGALGSATSAPAFGIALQNDSGLSLGTVTISFTGEQWRGQVDPPAFETLAFSYQVLDTTGAGSFLPTPFDESGWVSVPSLSFASLVNSTNTTQNGNLAANQTALSATISLNETWMGSGASNRVLWLRWVDTDDLGGDAGLAIDNLTVIPEPATYGALFSLLSLGVVIWRRRRVAR